MDNTQKRPRIKKRTDYGLNTDMSLDMFAKLCADECRRLRIEKGQLLAEIDEKNDKIASLDKQLQFKQNIIDLYEQNMGAQKDIKKDEIYKRILKENKRLKAMYDKSQHENKKMTEKIIEYKIKQQNHD